MNIGFLALFPLLLVLCTVAVATVLLSDTYTATASIIVSNAVSGDGNGLSASDIADLISSEQVRQSAAQKMGRSSLSSVSVNVSTGSGESIVGLSVTGAEDDRPDEVARALVGALSTELGDANVSGSLRLVGDVQMPESPSSPNRALYAAFAWIAGMTAAICLIVMHDTLDDTVKDERAIEHATDAPIIGRVPFVNGRKGFSGVRLQLEKAIANLQLSDPARTVKFISVCSSTDEEGKTFVSLGFARLLAANGRRVLLVDCGTGDARALSELGVKPRYGIDDVLYGRCSINHAVVQTRTQNLYVLDGSSLSVDAYRLLATEQLKASIQKLRNSFDYVIFDTPALLERAHGAALGRVVDVTILVVRWRFTRTDELNEALSQLELAQVWPAGLIINSLGSPSRETRRARRTWEALK